METTTRETTKSAQGRAERFYQNPVLRDQEWERAKQAPWWLTLLAVVIAAVAFFVGVYSGEPHNFIGWIVGFATIVVYMGLCRARLPWVRRRLRKAHGQATA